MSRIASNPKLSTRLSITLALTLMLILVIATIAAAISAYFEARDSQDETLLSVGYLVGTDQVSVQYNSRAYKDNEIDDGVRVWELGNNHNAGFKIKPSINDGFHTMNARGSIWRVLVVGNDATEQRFAVVQKLSVSTELAFKSAFNTALPLLGLLLLVPILIYFIVRHSFKPLRSLRKRIDQSDSLQPQALSDQSIPFEVEPFVNSIENLLEKNHQYNQQQRRFIADAAHELRTPITALSLEIENLEQARDEPTRQQRQSQLAGSVDRLQRLISQLLDLARSQSSGQEPAQAVSLNDLVRDQLSQLFMLAENKNISISVNRNEPVALLGAKSQLRHLVQNALSNAIKFTPDNGNIDIDIYSEKNHGVLCVRDDGPGVKNSDLPRLSEPFFRSDEHATGTGAGLGLAICQEIADNSGGDLSLKNHPEGGFEFRYSQPVQAH